MQLSNDGLKLDESTVENCKIWLRGNEIVGPRNGRSDRVLHTNSGCYFMFATQQSIDGYEINDLYKLKDDGIQIRQDLLFRS